MEPRRKQEAAAAAKIFGTEPIHLDHLQRHYIDDNGEQVELRYGCALPRGVAPDVPTILTACEHEPSITRLADLILAHNPEAILTHNPVMVNIEHFATSLLVLNAYRQAVSRGYEGMLLMWHDITIGPWGEAYVRWDTFVNVSDQWERKFEAIAAHACQIPVPANLELPEWGATCGCRHAEAFDIVSKGKRPAQGSPFNFEILRNAAR